MDFHSFEDSSAGEDINTIPDISFSWPFVKSSNDMISFELHNTVELRCRPTHSFPPPVSQPMSLTTTVLMCLAPPAISRQVESRFSGCLRSSYKLNGLDELTTYIMYIWASTNAGNGAVTMIEDRTLNLSSESNDFCIGVDSQL